MVDGFPNAKRKIVYIPMRADIIHPALINIIEKGSKLGNVVNYVIKERRRLKVLILSLNLIGMEKL